MSYNEMRKLTVEELRALHQETQEWHRWFTENPPIEAISSTEVADDHNDFLSHLSGELETIEELIAEKIMK